MEKNIILELNERELRLLRQAIAAMYVKVMQEDSDNEELFTELDKLLDRLHDLENQVELDKELREE